MVRWGRWWHSWSASPIGSCRIASGVRREGTVHRAPRQPGLRFGQALLAWLPRDHAATGAGEIDFEQPRMRRSQCEGEADLGAIPLHEEQMSSYVIAEQRVEAWVRWGNTSPSWTAGPPRRAAPIQLNFGFRYAFSQANSWFSLLPAKVLADAEAAFGSYGNRSHSHLSTSAVSWANWNAAGCRV